MLLKRCIHSSSMIICTKQWPTKTIIHWSEATSQRPYSSSKQNNNNLTKNTTTTTTVQQRHEAQTQEQQIEEYEMKKKNGKLTISDIVSLTNRIKEKRYSNVWLDAFDIIRNASNQRRVLLQCNEKMMNIMLEHLRLQRRMEDALFIYGIMKNNNWKLEKYRSGDLMNQCIDNKLYNIALSIFQETLDKDIHHYTAAIKAHIELDRINSAIELYNEINEKGMKLIPRTYGILLRGCAKAKNLQFGKLLHQKMINDGIELSVQQKVTLIELYGRCRDVMSAEEIFNSIPMSQRNIIFYTAMMKVYCDAQQLDHAVKLLDEAERAGIKANIVTYLILFTACADAKDIQFGVTLHNRMQRSGIDTDPKLNTSLINMYICCGDVTKALSLYECTPLSQRNTATYNSIIEMFCDRGQIDEAMKLFNEMKQGSIKSDTVTYTILFTYCANAKDLVMGKAIHQQLMKSGLKMNEKLQTSLIDMYGKCGDTTTATTILHSIPVARRSAWLYNTVIHAFCESNQMDKAMEIFNEMNRDGIKPDAITFRILLQGCQKATDWELDQKLRKMALESGIERKIQTE
jgi:pentatricopeptide repeat protein